MRLAVLFRRLGPYHQVRLDAAGQLGETWCVEGSGIDTVHAWDTGAPGHHFGRLTLFPNADSGRMPLRDVRRAVAAALDQIQPAVVAIPGWEEPLALAALAWAMRAGSPIILMSDSHEIDRRHHGLKEFIKRRIVGLCGAGFVSGRAATDYLVRLGMARDRIFTGYDVVDNDHFSQGAKTRHWPEAPIRADGALPAKHFLCQGRFIWEKNLERLLQAYARYVEQYVGEGSANPGQGPWHLVLMGDGPLRGKVEACLQELGVVEYVHLPGFVQYPDLPEFYRVASACILASVSETWGLVVNEAMASGLPVLVSHRCGCVPDLVQEGVNGFTFDPLDMEELTRLMLKVSAPGFPLPAFGAASREIISRWSARLFAENIWRAAETAIAAPPARNIGGHLLLSSLLFLR